MNPSLEEVLQKEANKIGFSSDLSLYQGAKKYQIYLLRKAPTLLELCEMLKGPKIPVFVFGYSMKPYEIARKSAWRDAQRDEVNVVYKHPITHQPVSKHGIVSIENTAKIILHMQGNNIRVNVLPRRWLSEDRVLQLDAEYRTRISDDKTLEMACIREPMITAGDFELIEVENPITDLLMRKLREYAAKSTKPNQYSSLIEAFTKTPPKIAYITRISQVDKPRDDQLPLF